MVCALSFVVGLLGHSAFSQETIGTYPNRAIRIVVTFPPGGPTDIIARAVAQKLSDAFGQAVIVDNRPGAAGNIGTALVAKAPADGYTLVLSNLTPMAISPFVYAKLPYDPIKDFAPITLAATSWFFLVVTPSLPATSVKELIALAQSKPGQLTYSSSGNATPAHLGGALFERVAGVRLIHVPYKGATLSVPAVMGGEVQMAIESPPPIVPQVKTGKLRALAAARPDRSQLLPDVPTFAEAGLPGLEVSSWYGFHVPAGTPQPIIDKLHAEMTRALGSSEMRERLRNIGADVVASTPARYTDFVTAEMKKWKAVIDSTGIKVE